uniref:Integrase catalytic domain-containing protein n=1 Tax=Sphaeramia orbicularis TaxID=375764 RepID=A0A673A4A0_9TELE
MDTLISDQGREFVNSVIDGLTDRLQTDHRIASAYHPQTNGQRERDNRTLKEALAKIVNEECDDWDMRIPGVLFAYHTSVHASTKVTPFEVMYGRKAKLPLDLKQPADADQTEEVASSKEEATTETLRAMDDFRKTLSSNVAENIQTAQHKNGDAMEWLKYPSSFSLQTSTEYALYIENVHDHFSVVLGVE